MKKLNILFVISSALTNGGVAAVTMKIVDSLKEECQFDIIVTGKQAGFYDEKFLSYGGKIIRTNTVDYQKSKIGIVKKGKYIYDAVIEACKEKKYDVIHCENGFESGQAVLAATKCGIPIKIVHAHGTYSTKGKNIIAKIYRLNCKRLIEKYSNIKLACSLKAGRSLFYSNFKNILNPLNVDYYQSIKKKEHTCINLLQIGYYCKLKNQKFSLQILEDLLKRNVDSKLYFIGFDDGSGYFPSLVKDIELKNLEERVFFLPSNFPKQEIMKKIDYLLLPSISEGLPLVALEAQSANIHTIVSDAVSDDVNLRLCSFLPISDSNLWVDEIISLIGSSKVLNMDKLDYIRDDNYIAIIKEIYFQKNSF